MPPPTLKPDLMNAPASPEQLKNLALFMEFTRGEMETLIELADPTLFKAGSVIVRQDEMGDALYIVVSGEAQVTHRRDGRDILLATLVAGDFFGELALVDDGPRSATVTATQECLLLKVPQAVLRALAGVYPNAAFKLLMTIAKVLVARMRKGNARYIDSLLAATSVK
jgi:CRP-like cAMP-binding protein